MADFTDTKGRTIGIQNDGDSVEATHKGVKVGEIVTTGIRDLGHGQDMPAKITFMNVEANYQHAGIGTEMIRQLVDELGMLLPAHRNIGEEDSGALTDAGMALTKRAQALGYVLRFDEE